MKILGTLKVLLSTFAQRFIPSLIAETISSAKQLEVHSEHWQRLTAAAAQDVILPDATSLEPRWSVVIESVGAGTLTVKNGTATPVAVQAVQTGQAFEFTLLDNSSDAGEWHINLLESSTSEPSERYIHTFNAITDWGSAVGGFYSLKITAATHERGTAPQVQVFEERGVDFAQVIPHDVEVAANGDVTIQVSESPDGRIAGRMVMV